MLGAAEPERVLVLNRGDGLHGVRTADGLGTRFRKAEVFHLARSDQVSYGACDLFDGLFGVDTVLVEQIDGVHLEALQGSLGHFFDVIGPAVEARPTALAVGMKLESELVAITTWPI